MTDTGASAPRRVYAGLFTVSLATVMFEILLTRIFSVTMWYHYAFMAISMALFGMTAGAVLVYLFPARFSRGRTMVDLAWGALGFSITVVASIAVHLAIPFRIPFGDARLTAAVPVIITYMVISVPFVFSGVCVSLALTRFPSRVSTLYAADLTGAACGCVLLIPILNIADGPTSVIVAAGLAAVAAMCFAAESGSTSLRRASVVAAVSLSLFAAVNAIMAGHQSAPFKLTWVKVGREDRPVYEKWNSFSRIMVSGDPSTPSVPVTWGLSRVYPKDRKVKQLLMTIDATASTVITAFNGDMRNLDYLAYDVTNVVHYIRRGARVLIVGSGGGRDVLAALMAQQRSIVAVELNRNIIDAVNRRFGDFSGHLDRDPRVIFINDEARSYIARTADRYDIIQLSLIDTAAATAAGAYVLTENSLYTTEAWTLLLRRLTPGGVLTVSRWYIGERPGEMYKATALAGTALRGLGVVDPRAHLVIVRRLKGLHPRYGPIGTATLLVSRQPFTPGDLARLADVARQLRFDVVLSPQTALDSTFATAASGSNMEALARTFPLKITPPTDDNPFFFDMVRLRDVFRLNPWRQGTEIFNAEPVLILVVLLIAVIVLTLACIIVPLALTRRRESLRGTGPLFVFFAGIGIGFMMVEISQMQRLIIFLGHPTYGLSVVLFALLVSSGLGSLLSRTLDPSHARGAVMAYLGLLLGALLVFGAVTPHAIEALRSTITAIRIIAAVLILFPLGVFMGMAFPLGMKLASTNFEPVTPWFWGVNGATSVCASVLAVVIAMSTGISAAFWTGVGCYTVAVAAFGWGCHSILRSPATLHPAEPVPTSFPLSAPGE